MQNSITTMYIKEKDARLGFQKVVEIFLSNHKSQNWEQTVTNMVEYVRIEYCSLPRITLYFCGTV